MKLLPALLSCAGLLCGALPATAEVGHQSVAVHMPAGDLGDAVESLAKQSGVSVLYPGDLLDGKRSVGVDGTYLPLEAFARVLEGTSLTFSEERGALRIVNLAAPTPASTPKPAESGAEQASSSTSECHRVLRGNAIQRYCGGADQWRDLQARVGFRCRNAGKRDELCASASDWKRWDLARATQAQVSGVYRRDEAAESTMQFHPPRGSDVAPTISAPVTPPAPVQPAK